MHKQKHYVSVSNILELICFPVSVVGMSEAFLLSETN